MEKPDASFAYDPADLLGRSVCDEKVLAYLRFHNAVKPSHIGVSEIYGGLREFGFCLFAESLEAYRRSNGEPRSFANVQSGENIVKRIDFSDAGLIKGDINSYKHPLPYGLCFEDNIGDIIEKLGMNFVGEPEYILRYLIGETVLICKLTAEWQLFAISLAPRSLEMRQTDMGKGTFGARLKAESRNIDPACVDKVEALRGSIPTPRWQASMADGDTQFTELAIAKAEVALNRFIDEVKTAAEKKSATAIHKAVKTVVMALNKLNTGGSYPIETLERDELGVLIDDVVKATGFQLKDNEDLTAEWREW